MEKYLILLWPSPKGRNPKDVGNMLSNIPEIYKPKFTLESNLKKWKPLGVQISDSLCIKKYWGWGIK